MKKLLSWVCMGAVAAFVSHKLMAEGVSDRSESARGKSRELMVYDARGKPAGRYFPGSIGGSYSSVVLNIDGALIHVHVAPIANAQTGIGDALNLRWVATSAYFPGRSCTGTPLLTTRTPGTRPVVVWPDASGNLIAYIGQTGSNSPQTYWSQGGYQPIRCNDLHGEELGEYPAWPLEKTVNISQMYPEPLTVR